MNYAKFDVDPVTAGRIMRKLDLLRAFDNQALQEVARVIEASVPLYDEQSKGKDATQAALRMADGIVSWLYIWAGRTKCPMKVKRQTAEDFTGCYDANHDSEQPNRCMM